jgi:hypothetical protein
MCNFDDQKLNNLYDQFTKPPAKSMKIPMMGYANNADSKNFDYILTRGWNTDNKRVIQVTDYSDFSKSWVYESSDDETWEEIK